FFWSAGRMLVSSHDCGIHEDFLEVGVFGQLGENPMPNALVRPARKSLVHAVPRSEFFRQIAPWSPHARDPQHRFHKAAIVLARAPRIAGFARQQILDAPPLIVGQSCARHANSMCSSRPPIYATSKLCTSTVR